MICCVELLILLGMYMYNKTFYYYYNQFETLTTVDSWYKPYLFNVFKRENGMKCFYLYKFRLLFSALQ